MEVKEVLYVSRLEKNLLFVLAILEKGLEVNFTGDEVFVKSRGVDLNVRHVIGINESKLYLLRGQRVKVLVHDNDNLSEL